jgi:hypothetical protein
LMIERLVIRFENFKWAELWSPLIFLFQIFL